MLKKFLEKIKQGATRQLESERVIWGIRQSAIVETIVFLTVISFVSYVFSDGTRYFNTHPHPYWVVLLAIIVQYGSKEGFRGFPE